MGSDISRTYDIESALSQLVDGLLWDIHFGRNTLQGRYGQAPKSQMHTLDANLGVLGLFLIHIVGNKLHKYPRLNPFSQLSGAREQHLCPKT